jgi:DNA repair exonuclease SbcCD ATPase subunit
MRLASLTLTNFRGFADEVTIPFDADVVVIWGSNGTGKTSLLDALQWLVLGDIPRLHSTALRAGEDYVSSSYATGPPSVTATFDGPAGRLVATRTGHGKEQRLTVAVGEETLEGERAEVELARLFPRRGNDDRTALQTYLLEQDDMRELLTGDTKERFRLLAELTGLGELQELDVKLRSELRSLRKALRERSGDVDRLRKSLETLDAEWAESQALLRQRLDADQAAVNDAEVSVRELVGDTAETQDAGDLLESAERRVAAVREAADELMRRSSGVETTSDNLVEIESLRSLATQHELALARLDTETSALEAREAELRDSIDAAERRETRTQQLARLALDDLGPMCPVCGQVHDQAETQRRLHAALSDRSATSPLQSDREQVCAQLAETRQRRLAVEAELRRTRDNLAAAEALAAGAAAARDALKLARKHLAELLGARVQAGASLSEAADSWLADAEERVMTLRRRLLHASDVRRLERSVEAMRDDRENRLARLVEASAEWERLTGREARAAEVCRWLGLELVNVTGAVVRRSTPLAGELFKRFDVHPTFRRFSFEPDRFHEAGHLRPWLHDDEADNPKEADATHVLSAAQLNALAVCVFLAVNLEQRAACETVMLDDPVQSMDDVNVLSLADVLRAFREPRQVVLTTHEIVLAQMLIRKLRPVQPGQKTLLIKLSRWTRHGPTVDTEENTFDAGRPAIELIGSDAPA